jgi:hypothetical protein
MKAVMIETDARPVRPVVTGEGGMERRTKPRPGVVGITIWGNSSVAVSQLQRAAQQMGQAFSQAFRQVSSHAIVTADGMRMLEGQVESIAQRRQRRQTLIRQGIAVVDRLGVEIEQSMIAFGELVLRTVGRVEHRASKLWAWLWGNQ